MHGQPPIGRQRYTDRFRREFRNGPERERGALTVADSHVASSRDVPSSAALRIKMRSLLGVAGLSVAPAGLGGLVDQFSCHLLTMSYRFQPNGSNGINDLGSRNWSILGYFGSVLPMVRRCDEPASI